ncbi:hypothetical protein GCM10023325_08580 [Sphingomonas lutea]
MLEGGKHRLIHNVCEPGWERQFVVRAKKDRVPGSRVIVILLPLALATSEIHIAIDVQASFLILTHDHGFRAGK